MSEYPGWTVRTLEVLESLDYPTQPPTKHPTKQTEKDRLLSRLSFLRRETQEVVKKLAKLN